MQNRKYFPFERNSYYFGKLLTAKDFEAEQRYVNDKRRFINRLTGANGIVAGLGVIMADDASIILQAGCAFDASGREIIVPETRVVKLSTIDGFAQLTSDSAYLGISYDEQPMDEVYSAMSDENGGVRHNKVREQYRLTLLDENLVAKLASPMSEFVSRLVVYAGQDVEVVQYTPKFVPKGCNIVVSTEIRRLASGTGEYSFLYTIDTPGFRSAQGKNSTEIVANNLKLEYNQVYTVKTEFVPEDYVWGGKSSTAFTLTGFTIQKNGEAFTLNQNLEALLKPVQQGLTDCYLACYYNKSMDKVLGESYDERLWISKIKLIRQNSSAIIDRIFPAPFGQYCYNAQQLMMLDRLEAYYPEQGKAGQQAAGTMQHPEQGGSIRSTALEQAESAKNTACGVFDFPLGLGYDLKQPLFSDEIMHGLGKGPVYVEVGIEYVSADERHENDSEIILGDASIFGQDSHPTEEERLYQVSTAVKVLPERGTFVVGLKLNEGTGLISLRIRWFAFRLGEVSKQLKAKHDGERMVLVNPDTIVLQPKGTAHIAPVFINMPSEACNYRLMDEESGSIDNNGVYTAPAREGVYEIRVEAISDPTVYTHVFAIVSQKKKE